MTATALFIFEGIQSTEPDSPARNAKIISDVLLISEGFAFSLASKQPRHAFVLRALGVLIFILKIVLMSIVQISTGNTAGKAENLSDIKMEEITKQSNAARDAAKLVQTDSDDLRNSKHEWKRNQAANKSEKALAALTAASAADEKLKDVNVSTPTIEIIGENGLIALSIMFSFAMEFTAIAFMYYAGTFRREAAAAKAGLSVEYQILSLLHEMRGSIPPHLQALQAPQLASSPAPAPIPALAAKPAPAGLDIFELGHG